MLKSAASLIVNVLALVAIMFAVFWLVSMYSDLSHSAHGIPMNHFPAAAAELDTPDLRAHQEEMRRQGVRTSR